MDEKICLWWNINRYRIMNKKLKKALIGLSLALYNYQVQKGERVRKLFKRFEGRKVPKGKNITTKLYFKTNQCRKTN